VARELALRHAFARACRRLSDRRIIRLVAEDATSLTYQFTAESRTGDRYEYVLETLLKPDKQTGTESCALQALATVAQEELDRCIAVRTGSDVTRVVQKLFEKQADLFPIRPQAGAYFVPVAHAPFVEQVQEFLGRVGSRLLRFPVPAGIPEGERSVRQAVADGLAGLIAEHRQAVAQFGSDTRPDTLNRAAALSGPPGSRSRATRPIWPRRRSNSKANWSRRRMNCGPRSSRSPTGRRWRSRHDSLVSGRPALGRPGSVSEARMTNCADHARARTVLMVTTPARWSAWPFLPVVRRTGVGTELGVVFDARHACGLTGYSATV
jgi:hypothetical protein